MPANTGRAARAVVAIVCGLPIAAAAILMTSYSAFADLPPVPAPLENPITEEKRILGKVLFWDEQLSSDNTISCGTCHQPQAGGADPRIAIHPGLDQLAGTPDDVLASPGVISCDANDDFLPSALFRLQRQATTRSANSAIMAMYAEELFWDGRATSQFIDPQDHSVSIASGGALESQVVGPPVSSVEMAHAGRDWDQIAAKLYSSRPLALATNLPADVSAALAPDTTYPELFAAAFGDGHITAERIAFAIATYERTLVPDQTDWDRWVDGDATALTPQERQGWFDFLGSVCSVCHSPPLFTDHSFRNIGLRPVAEDLGRQNVTGDTNDRGMFKTPTLRNAALKPTFMHNGQFAGLTQVMNFYANPGQQFPDNRDPLMVAINLPPPVAANIQAFIAGGLVDPRVATESFPFDRPTLRSQHPPNPVLIGGGTPGAGNRIPAMIAVVPPNLGNRNFKVGIANALPGAQAQVALSVNPPIGGVLAPLTTLGPVTLQGAGPGGGFGTIHWPIPDDGALDGQTVFMQWSVADPAAPGGVARSPVARIDLFCGRGICPTTCLADLTSTSDPNAGGYGVPNGAVDADDFFCFLDFFSSADFVRTDLTGSADPLEPLYGLPDGLIDASDFFYFLDLFEAGCP